MVHALTTLRDIRPSTRLKRLGRIEMKTSERRTRARSIHYSGNRAPTSIGAGGLGHLLEDRSTRPRHDKEDTGGRGRGA